MADRSRQKQGLSSLNHFERLALFGSVLIWAGVIAFGIGLAIAIYNLRVEQIAYANAADVASISTEAVADASPTRTIQLYPAGWSTATPTPTLTPTRLPTRASTGVARVRARISATPSTTKRPSAPSPTPTETPPPSYPPDRLVIPKIKLDSAIVPIGWTNVEQDGQTSRVWTVVDNVVGWHKSSALPGNVGNLVLNGHHNIKGQVFRHLVDVEVGDRVMIYARDSVYYYAVAEKHILKEKGEPIEVRRDNAAWIEATEDERVTLITCWPYTNNTHRLIVVAKPVTVPQVEGLER